jgi:hypothetical protein
MARFAVGQAITTREPVIEVDAGLAVGDHRFSLVVVGASGRRSAADVVTVRVQRLVIPGPIDRIDPDRLGGVVRPPAVPAAATPAKRPKAPPKRKRSDPK